MSGGRDFVIGCVGKPSSGKSTFFNAVSESKVAKVGAYPFTTIEANQGVGFYIADCPCVKYSVQCKPRYGTCTNGKRTVPIKLLDVAGLIPGASEGLGLGNKFLDDLRHADVLLHILDVSGTTNEKGEATTGYDPSQDHAWLLNEITLWIFNNLWKRWSGIARRHTATQRVAVSIALLASNVFLSTFAVTLQAQLSGYGARETLIQNVLHELTVHHTFPEALADWDKDDVMKLANIFVTQRFPFVLVLNKVDLGGDAHKNVIRIAERFDANRVVCTSALTECFLKKMQQQRYVSYVPGSSSFATADTDPDLKLRPPDAKVHARLATVRDMILFRLGSTGVYEAIQKAVEAAELFPVYPVKQLQNFGATRSGYGAFPECILVKKGITVREFARLLHPEIERHFLYAEGVNGCRLAEDDVLGPEQNIIRFVTHTIDPTLLKK